MAKGDIHYAWSGSVEADVGITWCRLHYRRFPFYDVSLVFGDTVDGADPVCRFLSDGRRLAEHNTANRALCPECEKRLDLLIDPGLPLRTARLADVHGEEYHPHGRVLIGYLTCFLNAEPHWRGWVHAPDWGALIHQPSQWVKRYKLPTVDNEIVPF